MKGKSPDKQPNNKNLNRGRWRKGQSGNPKGRPRKDVSVTSLIKELLDKPAEYIAPGATPGDKTWRQMIAKAILLGASKGNPQLVKELLDRLEGKVASPVELGTGDKPVRVEIVIVRGIGADNSG